MDYVFYNFHLIKIDHVFGIIFFLGGCAFFINTLVEFSSKNRNLYSFQRDFLGSIICIILGLALMFDKVA